VPLALYEEVQAIERQAAGFEVRSVRDAQALRRAAAAVAVATGYFCWPRRLGVPGEELPWVASRYHEPYPHFDQDVVVVGGGNSAVETALDLFRNGARVTLVHRGAAVKRSIKYWLKPDFEHRVEEGSIGVRLESRAVAFHAAGGGRRSAVEVEGPGGRERLPADAAYVLVGYRPDQSLLRQAGVTVDPDTLVPAFDPESCETNVPGLYVAGTLQAGAATDKVFIENSRDHAPRLVRHLAARLGR
jgi:thioredoxin reductase (NADPH)